MKQERVKKDNSLSSLRLRLKEELKSDSSRISLREPRKFTSFNSTKIQNNALKIFNRNQSQHKHKSESSNDVSHLKDQRRSRAFRSKNLPEDLYQLKSYLMNNQTYSHNKKRPTGLTNSEMSFENLPIYENALLKQPTGRQEAQNLRNWFERMTKQYQNNKEALTLIAEICEQELIQQISVECTERGSLIRSLLNLKNLQINSNSTYHENIIKDLENKHQKNIENLKADFLVIENQLVQKNNALEKTNENLELSLKEAVEISESHKKRSNDWCRRFMAQENIWNKKYFDETKKNRVLRQRVANSTCLRGSAPKHHTLLISSPNQLEKSESNCIQPVNATQMFTQEIEDYEELLSIDLEMEIEHINNSDFEEALMESYKLNETKENDSFHSIINSDKSDLFPAEYEEDLLKPTSYRRAACEICRLEDINIEPNGKLTHSQSFNNESILESSKSFKLKKPKKAVFKFSWANSKKILELAPKILDKFLQKDIEAIKSKSCLASKTLYKIISKVLSTAYRKSSTSLIELVYWEFAKKHGLKQISKRQFTNFIGTLLKTSENKRSLMFSRLLGIADKVNESNYNKETLPFYLSCLGYIHTSQIGIVSLKFTDDRQPCPTNRALMCAKEHCEFLGKKINRKIYHMIEKISVNDPKNINHEGIVELEACLEILCNVYDRYVGKVQDIVEILFDSFDWDFHAGVPREDFSVLVQSINYSKIEACTSLPSVLSFKDIMNIILNRQTITLFQINHRLAAVKNRNVKIDYQKIIKIAQEINDENWLRRISAAQNNFDEKDTEHAAFAYAVYEEAILRNKEI